MTRTRIILIIVLLSLACCLALLLPGCFKDPRQLVLGEWQELNNLGFVEVTDSTARWRGSNHKATFQYDWVQADDEPYTVEISRNGQKWLVDLTFDDDDHAEVNLRIFDQLPPQAQDFIRQKNKAKNRPEQELRLRFRRVQPEK